EERGTDAAGIAYHAGGRLHIMKKAKPAHVLRFRVPAETSVVMGHTRYATQGDAKKAYNAHPFQGQIGNKKFALAHNGVLLNDRLLQQAEDLPKTYIGTDSYVAVQLLEKQNALNFNSLRKVAEQVQGTFVFTVLDAQENLYFVHGDNPLCLYHFPKQSIYVYASTQSILEHGLTASGLSFLKKPVEVKTDEGDILRIDRHGKQKLQHFCINSFCPPCYSDAIEWYPKPLSAGRRNPDAYWEGLVSVAASFGYTPKDIHTLRECGFTSDEIEDFLYCGEI
ncbi:MAG: class II glutamine amidotransferase, partial [Firmicutes bacterium]|nr:class II glutamine amidotransferase [Bacillota bacterium]